MAQWYTLPAEIRHMILEALVGVHCNYGKFASICREWQEILEPHCFARLILTPDRIVQLNYMTTRVRSLVQHLWICLPLDQYSLQPPSEWDGVEGMSLVEATLIVTSLNVLFTSLASWHYHGGLVLDISVFSECDCCQCFRLLRLDPDDPKIWRATEPYLGIHPKCGISSVDIREQGEYGVKKIFGRIMNSTYMELRPFAETKDEDEWWRNLPQVPAVTDLRLRRQTHRRWYPRTNSNMLTRFPGLKWFTYESWREWNDYQVYLRAISLLFKATFTKLAAEYMELLDTMAHMRELKKFSLFENSRQHYLRHSGSKMLSRVPSSELGNILAEFTNLETLAASFMIDAEDFWAFDNVFLHWPNLTSLSLTSRRVKPGSMGECKSVLMRMVGTAMRMPKLQTMELWNGGKEEQEYGNRGFADLFKYEARRHGEPCTFTFRATYLFEIPTELIENWESVAQTHRNSEIKIVVERIDMDDIKSGGDAIHHLGLSESFIGPVSLQQMRAEPTDW